MKKSRKTRQNVIALIFDFDGTLSPNNMQEDSIFPAYGISKDRIWNKAVKLVQEKGYERTLAYLKLLIHDPVFKRNPLKRAALRKMASQIVYFPGVEDFFPRIRDFVASNAEAQTWGISVEFYIISSGMKELLEGTSIYEYFKRVYACEYEYGPRGPVFPKLVINDTNKIQFLFRINKGCLDLNKDINSHMSDEKRRIPFENMIYVGDSVTDIPSMIVTRKYGGCSIGVFDPASRAPAGLKALVAEERVNKFAPADYREGQLLEKILQQSINRMIYNIVDKGSAEMSRAWVRANRT